MLGTAEHMLPVLLIIATGYAARRTGLLSEQGRIGVERLTYYVLFPSLIFMSLATTDFTEFPALSMGATLFCAIAAMAVLSLVLKPALQRRLNMDGPAFTSLFQGVTRWNTFIGLALAGSLFGVQGLALISVAIVAIVPLANLMSVLVLAHYAARHPPTPATILLALLRNPFIWACALGMAANFAGILPPRILAAALDAIGQAAVATGLIAVGASLKIAALKRPSPLLLVAAGLKLIVMPLIGLGFALAFETTGMALGVTIIALAIPTATNSYIMAREMGGDADLMAETITFQTVIAMATLPIWVALVAQ